MIPKCSKNARGLGDACVKILQQYSQPPNTRHGESVTKFESLKRWKRFNRKGMNAKEQIVCALPGDEIMMS